MREGKNKLKHFIENLEMLSEGAPLEEGAVEWSLLSDFFKKANKTDREKLVQYIEDNDWDNFRKFVNKVVGNKSKK